MKRKFNLKKAPLAEMLLGVQFGNQTLSLPAIFSFYHEIKNDFPLIQEHPVTPNVIENLDKPTDVILLSGFQSRKFFITKNEGKLIQLQANRMNFNWRKVKENDEYPRFNNVYSEFLELYTKLEKISKVNFLINQYEIAYINHVPLIEFSSNPSNIISIIQDTIHLGNINFTFGIPVKELGGNVTVVIQKGKNKETNQDILMIQFSLRGFSSQINLKTWFEQAHDVLIDLFKKSITKEAKTKWEMEL